MEKLKQLFNIKTFKDKRNEIFEEFYNKVQNIGDEREKLTEKYKKFIEINNNKIITINGFKFNYYMNTVYLEPEKDNTLSFPIEKIKIVKIYNNINNLTPINEYICGDKYLNYILKHIYKMKNPRYCENINEINIEENSSISLNKESLSNFMDSTYNIIYDFKKPTIDYEKIKKYKDISFLDTDKKITDEYFLKSTGLDKVKDLKNFFFKKLLKFAKIVDLETIVNDVETKLIMFHNDNDYMPLEIVSKFEHLYNSGIVYYLYINFDIIKNLKRNKRLEYFAYCLLSFFPDKYESFNKFFEEKIKSKLTNKLTCLPDIIKILIKYIEENILNNTNENFQKENKKLLNNYFDSLKLKSNQRNELYKIICNFVSKTNDEDSIGDITTEIDPNNKNKNDNSDDSIISEKTEEKFVFIFDNVNNSQYFYFLENMFQNNLYNYRFKFLIIVPLNNDFCYNLFANYINCGNNIYFANYNDIDKKDELYEQKAEFDLSIFSNDENEENFYNLVRIFNFQEIYGNENDKNKFPIISFRKFIKYFNIEFDNKRQKISKIVFKNKNIEEIFAQKYSEILNIIKIKENHKLPNIEKQLDYLELEKLIISIIISKKQKNDFMVELFVHSIFGFKKIEIKKDINYYSLNIMIKQRSQGGEVFDFAIKIIYQNKTYLKFYQVTGFKSKEDLEKLIKEKISIYTSYIVKEFEKNNLGKIDGVSFGIITFTEIYNKDVYKNMKYHCKKNGFEYILFDINEMSFKIRKNGKYIDYNNEIFEFNNKYDLNIPKFDNIINVNNNIQLEILSPRPIKEIYYENKEDIEAQDNFKKISKQNTTIKRIAKFYYKGSFNDIKKLDKDYFIYYYDKSDNKSFFFDDKIINKQNNDYNKHITVILYTIISNQDEYEDSSLDNEKNNSKIKTKKNIKNINNKKINKNKYEKLTNTKINKMKKNLNKKLLNNIKDDEQSDESYNEINSKNSEITKKIYCLRKRKNPAESISNEYINNEYLNRKRK